MSYSEIVMSQIANDQELPSSGFDYLADATFLNRAIYGGADDITADVLDDYDPALDPDAVGKRTALNVYDRYDLYLKHFGFTTLSSADLGFAPSEISASETTAGLDHNFTYRGGLFRNNYQELSPSLEVPFTDAGAVALAATKETATGRVFNLVFRGTDADLGVDGEAATGPGQVRYYQQLQALIDKVYDYVSDAANDITEIVVSGHSLGGTVADLFALYDGARFAALNNVKLTVVALASAGVDPVALALKPDYDQDIVKTDAAGVHFETPDWYVSYDNAGDIVRNPGTYDPAKQAATDPQQAPITGFAISLLLEQLHFTDHRLTVETPLIDQYAVSAPLATNFLALHYASLYEMVAKDIAEAAEFADDLSYDRFIALNGLNAESSKTPGTNDASGFGVPVDDKFGLPNSQTRLFIVGLSGSDNIRGGASADLLYGGEGNDRLYGEGGRDILAGGSGDDIFDGGAGADTMFGGKGNDVYTVENAGDTVVEKANDGTDTVRSGISFTLADNVENLQLLYAGKAWGLGNSLDNLINGNIGDNVLKGFAGNDTLNGWIGADQMFGGTGNDTYFVDNAGDVVTELFNEGADTVQTGLSYTLGANVENLTLLYNGKAWGTGNALANTITGNSGDNVLGGLGGNDTLTGGLGADAFVFNTSLNASTNVDTITDFSTTQSDAFWLDDAVFTALAPGALQAADFVTGTSATNAAQNVIYDNATGSLFYDADGVGSAAQVKFASVTPGVSVTTSQFVVV